MPILDLASHHSCRDVKGWLKFDGGHVRTDVSKYELNPILDFGFMRSDAGEKHTAQKVLYYIGLSWL